jgi:hypothetical protein
VWKRLVKPVREGRVVPILGPGLLESICGTPFQTARRLADRVDFPARRRAVGRPAAGITVHGGEGVALQRRAGLPGPTARRPSSPSTGTGSPAAELPPQQPNPRLGRLLGLVGAHLLRDPKGDPFRILAELPASVYLTTNFDPLLEVALKENQRTPQSVVSRWRHQRAPEMAATQAIREATGEGADRLSRVRRVR